MDSPIKSSLVAETVAALKGVPTKEEIKLLLEQNVLVVDFTKLDGDKRVMTCTLREDMKPKTVVKEGVTKKVNDSVVNVWDVNAQGWRSFKYDRLNSAEVVEIYKEEWFRYDDNG